MKTKKNLLVIVSTFLLSVIPFHGFSLNYIINFTASGASNNVGSVLLQNLTKGTTVTVPKGNTLTLTDVATDVVELKTLNSDIGISKISNDGLFNLSFYLDESSKVNVSAYTIDGRKAADFRAQLAGGNNLIELKLPKGIFILQVSNSGVSFTSKFLNINSIYTTAEINNISMGKSKYSKIKLSPTTTITMAYNEGDQLLYKGISGNYSTIVTDRPTANKTTDFEFVECKDASGNYYPVVKIGTQLWMAENLKTTRYNNGNDIATTIYGFDSNEKAKYQWAYNNYEGFADVYGRLYTWYAASDSRGVAPVGWHGPSLDEWNSLFNYLRANRTEYENIYARVTKSLAATTNWGTKNNTCPINTIGNDLKSNNSTGFTAMPTGYRYPSGNYMGTLGGGVGWWSFGDNESVGHCHPYLQNDIFGDGRFCAQNSHGLSIRCIKD